MSGEGGGVDAQQIPAYEAQPYNLLDAPRGFLTLLEEASRVGGIVQVQSQRPFFLLSEPRCINEVLTRQHSKLFKRLDDRPATRRLFGEGLLTSDGDLWLRHRKLVQPAFSSSHLGLYVPTILEMTLQHTRRWEGGQFFDLLDEMERLTLRVGAATLFGIDAPLDGSSFGETVDAIITDDLRRLVTDFGAAPAADLDLDYVEDRLRYIDDAIGEILEVKRRAPRRADDVLSSLFDALDRGELTAKELRDETVTLLVAGYETTALATTWAWYLLCTHPEAEQQFHAEVDAVGDSLPTSELLQALPYTRSVVMESLRLFPPVYAFGRTAREAISVDGHTIPAHADVCISPWVMHRSSRFFDAPEAFRPERWLEGLAERLPPYAFIPFGGGPRSCLGSRFAPLEATLLLATIGRRFSFRLQAGTPAEPVLLLTLRPRGGMPVTLHTRS